MAVFSRWWTFSSANLLSQLWFISINFAFSNSWLRPFQISILPFRILQWCFSNSWQWLKWSLRNSGAINDAFSNSWMMPFEIHNNGSTKIYSIAINPAFSKFMSDAFSKHLCSGVINNAFVKCLWTMPLQVPDNDLTETCATVE